MSTSHSICLPHILLFSAAICVIGLGHSHIQPGQIPRLNHGRRGNLVFDGDSAGVTTEAKYDTDTRAEQAS